mmetsp:Transcript_41716/g.53810  ORF Transcript_41716/g.53810 Transcript_41716/m.53810 type:complete len:103 (+) Transcript_41716:161-469(+)
MPSKISSTKRAANKTARKPILNKHSKKKALKIQQEEERWAEVIKLKEEEEKVTDVDSIDHVSMLPLPIILPVSEPQINNKTKKKRVTKRLLKAAQRETIHFS